MLFHRKRDSLSTKLATVRKYIESIFVLIEKNTFVRKGNFETKNIFQKAKVFGFEMSKENSLKKLDLRKVIFRNWYVINIYKNYSNASVGNKSK